jgi:hypothetical protein
MQWAAGSIAWNVQVWEHGEQVTEVRTVQRLSSPTPVEAIT